MENYDKKVMLKLIELGDDVACLKIVNQKNKLSAGNGITIQNNQISADTANIYSHLDFKTKLNSANMIARVYSFVNKKYNISEQKVLNMENLSEEEILAKIKLYQRMLRSVRRKNQLC